MSARLDRASRIRWAVATVAATGALVPALLVLDHRTPEHANRLFRDGEPAAAAEIYAAQDGNGGQDAVTTFNYGTSLLAVDLDAAAAALEAAATAEDGALRQPSLYNAGYAYYIAAHGGLAPDSSAALLRLSIESNRLALRLDPTDDAARWNLAMAQRAYDALIPPGSNQGRESAGDSDDEVPMNDPAMARTESSDAESTEEEDPRPAENAGDRRGPREGARETWATQDPGPLSVADARAYLAAIVDDPEALVRGLLWSHRPDVAWWAGQAYPGGPW